MRAFFLSLCLLFASPAFADPFTVEGDTLIYDTERDDDEEIDWDHVDRLRTLLQTHDIAVLQLNSTGGRVFAAHDMADVIVDFDMHVHVHGTCESACVRLLLAGTQRTMSRGSSLGFHRFYWDAEDVEAHFERHKDRRDWATPFDQASWIYSDTQTEVQAHLMWMIARGVDPVFAIRSLSYDGDEMWRPYRPVLRAAGVLTE
ncbi:MAG: hypothetical protein AAGF60_06090 [Pseudomonadota bacterium]